jgi:phosphopantothenoylcysteine decarboxylase/phosphopantothenate--cysteine ligase
MATGRADDLASSVFLASDKQVLLAPAMNVRMWTHPATQANMDLLQQRGVLSIGPVDGAMACGEYGPGRMAEPEAILHSIKDFFGSGAPLSGRRALVTSGPTYEAIDPVRYIANRSSGRQGHAIALALSRLGARTTLVSGPTSLPEPAGVEVIAIESATEMMAACEKSLPVDVAVCAAAVSDWRVAAASRQKLKKNGGRPPLLQFADNPDVLASLSAPGNRRPPLVVGFAAETEKVVEHAQLKRARKGCDWILANDVSPRSKTFGGDENTVSVIDSAGVEHWPRMSKEGVAERLANRIADYLRSLDRHGQPHGAAATDRQCHPEE